MRWIAARLVLVLSLMVVLGVARAAGPAQVEAALGFCGGLSVTILGTGNPDVLRGTPGNDVIKGLGGDDIIRGRGGNDTICGHGGNDTICGGAGNDDVFGGASADTLNGESGLDRLYGDPGRDTLRGGPQNDIIVGGAGNDNLDGQAGFDQADFSPAPAAVSGAIDGVISGWGLDVLVHFESLVGSRFNDILFGSPLGDHINGYDGDDTMYNTSVIHGFDAANQFVGGQGTDTVSYVNANAAIFATFDFTTDSVSVIISGGSTDQLFGVEALHGSDFDDQLTGSGGNDILSGGFGIDTVYGGAGDDNLSGGDGNDTIRGDTGDDFLDSGSDFDTLDGGSNSDTCIAGEAVSNCEA